MMMGRGNLNFYVCPCSGPTPTEQFLIQVCNAQNARFNGSSLDSSLLSSTSGTTSNALVCCTACLASVSLSSPSEPSDQTRPNPKTSAESPCIPRCGKAQLESNLLAFKRSTNYRCMLDARSMCIWLHSLRFNML